MYKISYIQTGKNSNDEWKNDANPSATYQGDFNGDDDMWVDGFISYLEDKYWNKTFHFEYEHQKCILS